MLVYTTSAQQLKADEGFIRWAGEREKRNDKEGKERRGCKREVEQAGDYMINTTSKTGGGHDTSRAHRQREREKERERERDGGRQKEGLRLM